VSDLLDIAGSLFSIPFARQRLLIRLHQGALVRVDQLNVRNSGGKKAADFRQHLSRFVVG
jgi:hypothetical protein